MPERYRRGDPAAARRFAAAVAGFEAPPGQVALPAALGIEDPRRAVPVGA